MKELGVKELKKLSLRLGVNDNTSAGDDSGETIVSNFSKFLPCKPSDDSNFSNF